MRSILGGEIAMIFQEPRASLSPVHTVADQITENILLHQNVNEKEAWDRAVEMLHQVNIPKPEQRMNAYAHQLSGGMCQRVMIAMALSCHPDLLIADEPTTALDVTTEAQILERMQALQEELNMAIMFITHDLGVVAEMADEVAVMYVGQLVELADAAALYQQPLHPYTEALLSAVHSPDPANKTRRQRIVLEGDVADPANPPSGCYFHPRCSYAQERCKQEEPRLREISARHYVACHFAEELDLLGTEL